MNHITPGILIVLFLGWGLFMAVAILWPEKI